MKLLNLFIILILIHITTSSTQCRKCITNDLRLDNSRTWLPLKGKTQLIFLDRNGQMKNFSLHVIDTIETAQNLECSSTYNYEYIKATLYLNTSKTDLISLQLASPSSLSIRANTDTSFNIGIRGFLNQASSNEGHFKTRLYNYNIGNRTYSEVLLVKHNPGSSDSIDSLFLANGTGIIGFNYLNQKYILQ